jgi:transcription elongation factor Elf1
MKCESIDKEMFEAAFNLIYMNNCHNDKKIIKTCQICKTTTTPLWRKSKKYTVLCNRCGIKCRVNENKAQQYLIDSIDTRKNNVGSVDFDT